MRVRTGGLGSKDVFTLLWLVDERENDSLALSWYICTFVSCIAGVGNVTLVLLIDYHTRVLVLP